MALLQGSSPTLQGGTPNLQGGTPPPVPAPVGVKAKSPVLAAPKPINTLPPAQIAPKDLSGIYGRTNDGTIYNKNSQTKFSNPADFFKDSGVTSFDNLKFDTAYTPSGRETIYGQQQAPAVVPPTPTPQPTVPPTPGPYSPPNGGTTGVSQGGIIGNLLGIANNETPEVTNARNSLKSLQEDYAKKTSQIEGSPIDLSLATGQEGILNRLFAAKSGAAQTALSSALTSQGQQISATQGAGSLNAPITNPQTGALVTPSTPSTVGTTTSGAQNVSSLIGQGDGTNGHPKGEFFVNSAVGGMQAGQGFSSPQQLADFVNSQVPGANANAGNVFQLLNSGALNSSNGGGAQNPLNQLSSIAQQVINKQISPSQAYAMGGTIPNWQSVLNAELNKQSPGFDTSAAQAAYDSNQQSQTQQGNQVATWTSSATQAKNLGSQLNNLITTYGLNPNTINVGNALLQAVGNNTSDARYISFQNLITDLSNTYANVLTPSGGSVTDMVRSISSSLLGSDNSGKTISQVIQSLDAAVQAKIAGVKTPSTAGTPVNTGGGNTGGGSGGTWNW